MLENCHVFVHSSRTQIQCTQYYTFLLLQGGCKYGKWIGSVAVDKADDWMVGTTFVCTCVTSNICVCFVM